MAQTGCDRFRFHRPFLTPGSCICSDRTRRLGRPTCIQSPFRTLQVSSRGNHPFALLLILASPPFRMERHRRRLRIHFGGDLRRRLRHRMGCVTHLRRTGTGRSPEVVGAAKGSHQAVGHEDPADCAGLLAQSDVGEHRRRRHEGQVRQTQRVHRRLRRMARRYEPSRSF